MRQMLISIGFAMACNYAVAADFTGTYKCNLIDNSDGKFTATLVLKKDISASFDDLGYASYLVNFNVNGIPYAYTGMAAQRGNELALYFESTGRNKNPDDRGVGIASIIVDKDKNGKKIVSFHKFYYEKTYKGKSNYGFEKCVKI